MLPKPDRRPLRHSPIELAIFELHLLGGATTTIDAAAALKLSGLVTDAGWEVSHVEPAERKLLQLRVGPDNEPGVVVGEEAQGWSLTGSDTNATAQIFPKVVSVQVNGYHSWEQSLQAPLTALVHAVQQVLSPDGVQRVGLRYINRLTDPQSDKPQSWRGRVSESLLAPSLHPAIGDLVVGAQQQLDLAWHDGAKGVVRHGPFTDGSMSNSMSYLLDIDISDPASGPFKAERVLSVAEELHLLALSVFQAALTTEYLDDLRGGS